MGNAGRVLMIPKGDYNAATTYEMLDCVYYNGRSYVCKQASTGHAPTDTTYWQPMTPDASAEIQALTNYVGDSGVKNQLNTKALLDISASAGITYSLNADGSIDVQAGTTTAELIILSTYRSKGVAIPYKPNTTYVFSIGENKKQANLALQVLCKETSSSSWSTLGSGTNVDSVEFTTPATMYELWIRLDVASGKAVTATTLFPMVRDATITDPTYQPYAKTNVELTQDVASLISVGSTTKSGITAAANTVTDVTVTDIDIPTGYTLKAVGGITIGSGGVSVGLVSYYVLTADSIFVRIINNGAEKSGVSITAHWLAVKN